MLINNKIEYKPYEYKDEEELEAIVFNNPRLCFKNPKTIFFDKFKLKTISGEGTITDGFAITVNKDVKLAELKLVEIEKEEHPLYDHINNQFSKFTGSLKSTTTRENLAKSLYKSITEDPTKKSVFDSEDITEIYMYISELIRLSYENKTYEIVAIFDKRTKIVESQYLIDRVLEDIVPKPKIIVLKTYKNDIGECIYDISGDIIENYKKQDSHVKVTKKVNSSRKSKFDRYEKFILNNITHTCPNDKGYTFTDIELEVYKTIAKDSEKDFDKIIDLKLWNSKYDIMHKSDPRVYKMDLPRDITDDYIVDVDLHGIPNNKRRISEVLKFFKYPDDFKLFKRNK